MENKEPESLGQFFKFSILCNILPYYGYLHEWKEVLQLICKKTSTIWNENWEAFMYLGRRYKYDVKIFQNNSWHIPKNAELFILAQSWMDSPFMFSQCLDDGYLLKFNEIIFPLLNQLNENKVILIDKTWFYFQTIRIIRKDEISGMVPSSLCTSSTFDSKKFKLQEGPSLCQHIDEMREERIIISKSEEDTIEVDNIIQNSEWGTQLLDILNEDDYEKLRKWLLWPIKNCLWKPNILWFSSDRHDGYEIIDNKLVEYMISLTLLENIKQLNITFALQEFDSISNIIKISKAFSQLKLRFNIEYNWDKNKENFDNLQIDAKQIVWISNGWQFVLKGIREYLLQSFWEFTNFISYEKEGFTIFKITKLKGMNLMLGNDLKVNKEKQLIIDSIKENTNYKNDLFIVVDNGTFTLNLKPKNINNYTPIFKYCRCISLELNECKENISEIMNLPKQNNYEFKTNNISNFLESEEFSIVKSNFKNFHICNDNLKVRIINAGDSHRKISANKEIVLYDEYLERTSTVNISQLKAIIQKEEKN